MEGVQYDDSSFSAVGSPLSISDGARHFAASIPGVVRTYSTNKPVCDPEEVTLRLAIHLGGSPQWTSWGVFHQVGEGRGKTYASCDRCYTWLRNLYSLMTISTDVCVPRAGLSCAGLTMETGFTQDINGFAAYVIDDGTVTLVASDSGPAIDGTKIYSLDDTVSGGRCHSTDFPSQSPSL